MLFTSLQFVIFYIVVLVLFFTLPDRFRWILLLAASLYFYMCWNWKYVVFLLFVITVDYWAALGMERARSLRGRKSMLAISLRSSPERCPAPPMPEDA